MPGRIREWPAWPEYTSKDDNGDLVHAEIKREIIEQYGEEAIRSSWLKVCEALKMSTDRIARDGTDAIPTLTFDEFMNANDSAEQRLKDTGCFVIRNVVPTEQADQWYTDIKTLLAENEGKIGGWPAATPSILRLYFSSLQMQARSYPNSLLVQKKLNALWHGYSAPDSTPDPLTYCDAVRVRPPKIPFLGLGPHIDAGSLCRWGDPTYRSFYDAVFSGKPAELDMYDVGKRKDANQALYEGGAHSTVFRAFQGWTALTSAGAGEGSLLLYPDVKASISYVLLRPFFRQPENEDEVMDAEKWTFDEGSSWFAGTFKDDSQFASPTAHPHLRLKECMVSIPTMYPGDTVWWHSDMLHAVEVEHNGDHDASVVYVAATPNTATNRNYIKRQRDCFLAGKPPPDFSHGGIDERTLKGWMGERAIYNEDGRKAFGFGM